MNATNFEMERSIARCRVLLSGMAALVLWLDPTTTGGPFAVDRYLAAILVAHLAFSFSLLWAQQERTSTRLATLAACGDVLFAAAVARAIEGMTSPFYPFFAFAVLTVGMRSGLRPALVVTGFTVALYTIFVQMFAPGDRVFSIEMRSAYIAITGYLVGYLGQERLEQDKRIRALEANAERERIARSLHDGYAQALAGVNLRLESCRELLRRGRIDEVLEELSDLQSGVNREHDELRAYIRSLIDLETTGTSSENRPDAARVSVRAEFYGSAAFIEHVLLIMLEGARNVRRHAHARSASIAARMGGETLVLAIDDDGIGFREDAIPSWSMVSRVAECGGEMTMSRDGRPGGHVLIQLPVT